MICLTIEFNDKEWFIDHSLDEMRMVSDQLVRKKFSELTLEELAEVEQALEYRFTEVTSLQELVTELQYSTTVTYPPKGAWGTHNKEV